MKSYKSLFLSTILISSSVFLTSCGTKSHVRVIKLASSLSPSAPVTKAFQFMNKKLKQKSKGTMRLKIYASAQLGNEREALELLQIGSIGMTKVSAAALESFDPAFKAVDMPYIFQSEGQRFKVLQSRIGQKLLRGAQQYWMRGLCYYDAGSRSFYGTGKPIHTPADLKGKKVRVQNSNIAVQMVRQLGGAATPIPFGSLYSALQQDVVDAAENNPPSLYLSHQYEVIDYYALDKHTSVPDVLLVSTTVWKQLTPRQQQWLQEAASESARYEKKIWARETKNSLKKIKKSGVKIIHPDKNLFSKKVQPMYRQYKSSYPKVYETIQQIRRFQKANPSTPQDSV